MQRSLMTQWSLCLLLLLSVEKPLPPEFVHDLQGEGDKEGG